MARSQNQRMIHLYMRIGRAATLWYFHGWLIPCMLMSLVASCIVRQQGRYGWNWSACTHKEMDLKFTICRGKSLTFHRIRWQLANTTPNSSDCGINCWILSHCQSVLVVRRGSWVLHMRSLCDEVSIRVEWEFWDFTKSDYHVWSFLLNELGLFFGTSRRITQEHWTWKLNSLTIWFNGYVYQFQRKFQLE